MPKQSQQPPTPSPDEEPSQPTPPTEPPTPPPPAPAPTPSPAPRAGNRFFGWMRSLGITREPGWIGGVCAGIAQRLGIDPLIVRGVAVVVVVLGGPALLLYAAGWLLLPDRHDKIHLEEVLAGRFESPIAGIGALIVLSMLPVTQGFWFAGSEIWGNQYWGVATGRALWSTVLLGLIVWFVVWIARRSGSAPTTHPPTTGTRTPDTRTPGTRPNSGYATPNYAASNYAGTAYADTLAQPVPAASADGSVADGSVTDGSVADGSVAAGAGATGQAATTPTAAAFPTAAFTPEPGARPAAPAATASAEEFAAWRDRQAQWKATNDAFRTRAANEQRTANLAAQAQYRAERDARREIERAAHARTRSNPLYSFVAIGLSLVIGGVTALVIGAGSITGASVIAGLGAMLAVLAVAIIVNGVRGRRPGGSQGVAIVVLIPLIIAAMLPHNPQIVYLDSAKFTPVERTSNTDDIYIVGAGDTTIDFRGFLAGPKHDEEPGWASSVDLVAGASDITVIVPTDARLSYNAYVGSGSVTDAGETARLRPGTLLHERYDYLPEGATAQLDGSEQQIYLRITLGTGNITFVRAGSLSEGETK